MNIKLFINICITYYTFKVYITLYKHLYVNVYYTIQLEQK